MRLLERFHQPENFDAVADGAGWVMYAGGNDWENGITAVAVTFPSDEQLKRIWFTVKHKGTVNSGETGSAEAKAVKEWGNRAWRAWKREATAAHRNKNHGTRSWQNAFKTALTSDGMKSYVKEWGTERTSWEDVKESVYKRDKCGICGSLDVVAKTVRIDQLDHFLRGEPVNYVSRNDPNTTRLLICDGCKAVMYNNQWHPVEMESLAHVVVNRLLETDVDAPDIEHWSRRISVEEQLNELFGSWRPYYKNDPQGNKGKRWGNWFKFGPYESRVDFVLHPQKPSGSLRYELEDGGWKHHNSEFVTGQANVLKMIEIFKESVEQLRATPPTKITEVVRALERPISYAYGVERYGDQTNHLPQRRDEGRAVHHRGVVVDPEKAKIFDCVKEILEADDELDPRAEVDRLLPTKTYVLKGNSMINAAGVISMAQHEWHSRSSKQRKWAMNLVKAWPGLPEEAYLAILNGQVEVEAAGDDATVTIKQY